MTDNLPPSAPTLRGLADQPRSAPPPPGWPPAGQVAPAPPATPPPATAPPATATRPPGTAPAIGPPTAHGAEAPAPTRGRPRRARRVLAVLGGLVVAVLLAPTPLVQPFADRAARGYQDGCATFTGLEVDPGSWPVVARAVVGRLRGVSTHADEVAFDNGAVFHEVDVAADEVNGPPLRFGAGGQEAEIRGGVSSATVRLDDIERSLAAEGISVDLRADAGALVADVEVPVIGVVPTSVEAVPTDGDLELRFAPFDAFPLPPMTIALPDPVAVQTVDITAEGVRVSSTVEGTLSGQEWGCDTDSDG